MTKGPTARKPRKVEKKVAPAAVEPEKREEFAEELVEKMTNAHEADLDAFKKGKAYTAKIELLEEVERAALRRSVQPFLFKAGILKAYKSWLEPMPDGTVPNIAIRRSICERLLSMNLSKPLIYNSELGKIINFYCMHERENPEFRRTVLRLKKKWTDVLLKEEDFDES